MSIASAVQLLSIGGSSIKTFKTLLPTLVQEADIVVTGAPHAKRQDMYWLAVSTAFGMISNFTITGALLPKGLIMMEYNAEQNHVRFYCKQISTWAQVWYSLKSGDPFGRFTTKLFGGPQDITVGGKWEWWDRATPGIPGVPGSVTGFGKLGWEGEPILVKTPTYISPAAGELISYNPHPAGDDQSRGLPGIANEPKAIALDPTGNPRPDFLVFQALACACDPKPNLGTLPVEGDLIKPHADKLLTREIIGADSPAAKAHDGKTDIKFEKPKC